MVEFSAKLHESGGEKIAALCDCELLGKEFFEGDLCLDINREFFGGEKISAKKAAELLKSCTSANIVGNKIIAKLVKSGIIDEKKTKEINGVRYAMIFRL